MATTAASRKAKGRRLQQHVLRSILELSMAKNLSESDVRSVPGGVNGVDIWLSSNAQSVFPFSVECKNTEKLNIWDAIKQSEKNGGELTPLLVFSRNHSDVYCALKLSDFLSICERGANGQGQVV